MTRYLLLQRKRATFNIYILLGLVVVKEKHTHVYSNTCAFTTLPSFYELWEDRASFLVKATNKQYVIESRSAALCVQSKSRESARNQESSRLSQLGLKCCSDFFGLEEFEYPPVFCYKLTNLQHN